VISVEYKNKNLVVDILASSFDKNKSINYIIKQDKKRVQRIRNVMEYCFDICYLFGNIFLSDDKKSCALILLPEKKETNLKSILLNLKLIFFSIGLANLRRVLKRESEIKKFQLKEPMYYLWFIGVHPTEQNKGFGSSLLAEVIKDAGSKQRIICLETSTVKNISWYKKFGFSIYHELDLGYRLFFLRTKI
jgi:ribosomal protein S18 acetylase RimI-like enzyme